MPVENHVTKIRLQRAVSGIVQISKDLVEKKITVATNISLKRTKFEANERKTQSASFAHFGFLIANMV